MTTAAMSQCPTTTTVMARARRKSTTRLRVAGVASVSSRMVAASMRPECRSVPGRRLSSPTQRVLGALASALLPLGYPEPTGAHLGERLERDAVDVVGFERLERSLDQALVDLADDLRVRAGDVEERARREPHRGGQLGVGSGGEAQASQQVDNRSAGALGVGGLIARTGSRPLVLDES